MIVPYRFSLSVSFSFLLLSGCAPLWKAADPDVRQVTRREESRESTSETVLKAPYALEVQKEEYDGEYLALVATVIAHKELTEKDPLIRVVPYQQGRPLAASTYTVSDYAATKAKRLESGSLKVTLPLVVPASNMSDYQIELLWGKEAKAAYAERSIGRESGISQVAGVLVQQVELIQGDTLYAVLRNSSKETLQELGVQVAFAKYGGGLDFQKAFQENGVLLELHDLHLKPGAEKKLKILLEDTSFLEAGSLQASYRPFIRIVPLQDETLEIYE